MLSQEHPPCSGILLDAEDRPAAVAVAAENVWFAIASLQMKPLSLLFVLAACSAAGTATPRCQLRGVTLNWVEGSLASWDVVRERDLKLPDAPPPPLILFDRSCVYSFAAGGPGALRLRAGSDTLRGEGRAHGGAIALPNGLTLRVRAEAFSSLLPGDTATFLVMALEDVWRRDPEHFGEFENWSAYLRRSFVHEMVHTRQLVAWAPMLRIAGGRVGLSDFDDDIVQRRFDTVPLFRDAVRNEIALLYAAASATRLTEQRDLARQAIRMMRNRRIAIYGGEDAPWARLEQLLLDMEGAAQWAALAHVTRVSRAGPDTRREIVRGSRQYWSQDQGLALYMVLASLVPDWPREMFSANPPSSLDLLDRALR